MIKGFLTVHFLKNIKGQQLNVVGLNLTNAMHSDWLQEIAVECISSNKQLGKACCKNRTLGPLIPLGLLSTKGEKTFNARVSSSRQQ